MHITLTTDAQARIFAHLQAAYPNEGGGFLLGTPSREVIAIRDIVPVDNVFEEAEQYHRYAMTPQDWMRLEDEADSRNLTLVGYFHSHPNAPAIPSEYDRDHALPNFTYLITAVYDGQPREMRAWHLRPDRTQFDEQTLVVGGGL